MVVIVIDVVMMKHERITFGVSVVSVLISWMILMLSQKSDDRDTHGRARPIV